MALRKNEHLAMTKIYIIYKYSSMHIFTLMSLLIYHYAIKLATYIMLHFNSDYV